MKILTANRLTDGEAVWLASDHSWAVSIQDAEIASDDATQEKLERAGKAAFIKNEVVDVTLIDVAIVNGVANHHQPSARTCEGGAFFPRRHAG